MDLITLLSFPAGLSSFSVPIATVTGIFLSFASRLFVFLVPFITLAGNLSYWPYKYAKYFLCYCLYVQNLPKVLPEKLCLHLPRYGWGFWFVLAVISWNTPILPRKTCCTKPIFIIFGDTKLSTTIVAVL